MLRGLEEGLAADLGAKLGLQYLDKLVLGKRARSGASRVCLLFQKRHGGGQVLLYLQDDGKELVIARENGVRIQGDRLVVLENQTGEPLCVAGRKCPEEAG